MKWRVFLLFSLISTCAISEHPVSLTLYSLQCIGCHDKESPLENHGFNHPVGMTYPMHKADYAPVDVLETRIPLPEGRVACVSCHTEMTLRHVNYNLLAESLINFTDAEPALTGCTTCHRL